MELGLFLHINPLPFVYCASLISEIVIINIFTIPFVTNNLRLTKNIRGKIVVNAVLSDALVSYIVTTAPVALVLTTGTTN